MCHVQRSITYLFREALVDVAERDESAEAQEHEGDEKADVSKEIG